LNAAAGQQEQASFAGIEPPAQADVPCRFGVWGVLRESGRTFVAVDGTVQLQVLLTQHLRAHPEARHVLATYHYPDLGCANTTAMTARAKAARLPAGTEVIVIGVGLEPALHHGERVMRIVDCLGIEAVDRIQNHHTAEA